MRIDTASHFADGDAAIAQNLHEHEQQHVMQIEPGDAFETILMALRLRPEPTILLLPEQGQAFSDPEQFAQLQELRDPHTISFIIPNHRIAELGRYAYQYGFSFASSLEKAVQFLPPEPHHEDLVQSEQEPVPNTPPHLPEWPSLLTKGPLVKKHKLIALTASMVALLIAGSTILLPALFTTPKLITQPAAAPATMTVGEITFSSSGQLDPTSSTGLNDIIAVNLHNLSTPTSWKKYYAWLLPDKTDDNTMPLLLGALIITNGKTQLTYTHPDHNNLLATYSRFEVASQDATPTPTTPPLDAKDWRYVGAIPDIPTPGDEEHFSLLDHIRHLLAKDPTLQQIGLSGGLDTWLNRNSEKVLEWSSAARDSWQGGQQTDLIHRQMLRVLEFLDGAAYVYNTGDIPLGSPLLVDPKIGRIGLLEVTPTQVLPAYLSHVDIHLQGMSNAPGHTKTQQQLAIKLDTALKADTILLQKVRQDATTLAKMNTTQLKSNGALTLLNDMVSNANTAYTGQFDQATGGNINGISWICNELQGIASMAVVRANK